MKVIPLTTRTIMAVFIGLYWSAFGFGQTSYLLVPETVIEERPVKKYRLVDETSFTTQRVTENHGLWVNETRERRTTVFKPVEKTRILEQKFLVQKPIVETSYREREVSETEYETVTEMREEQYYVDKPVVETQYREEQHLVRKPVNTTIYQPETVVTYKPETQVQSTYSAGVAPVTQSYMTPANNQTQLQWLSRGYYFDPQVGQMVYRRPGFHWVQSQSPATIQSQTTFMPVLVPQQTLQTNLVPEVTQQYKPVTVTQYQDQYETRRVPIQVQRTERVLEKRSVPVTVQRPVIRTRTEKIPVETVRMENQEVVQRSPYTETVMEAVEQVEPYTVQVYKVIPETKEYQIPIKSQRWQEYTEMERVSRVVWKRVPLDANGNPIPTPPQSIGESTVIGSLRPVDSTLPVDTQRQYYGKPLLLDSKIIDPAKEKSILVPETEKLLDAATTKLRGIDEALGDKPADRSPALQGAQPGNPPIEAPGKNEDPKLEGSQR